MDLNTHLDLDQLTAYLADPEATSPDTGRHLARCPACRSRLGALAALKRHHRDLVGEAAPDFVEDETGAGLMAEQSIERYVDGDLHGEACERVAAGVAEDGPALKAALHYARHSAAMQRALPPSCEVEATPAGVADGGRAPFGGKSLDGRTLFETAKAWLGRRVPLWTNLPTAALVAGGLAFFLIFIHQPPTGGLQVAPYRDSPGIAFTAPHQAPGIGFFHSSPAKVEPFETIRVSLSGSNSIDISWPQVPQALGYRLRLARYENGVALPLTERTTTDTRASFEGLEIRPGQRYVWTLSGNTAARAAFRAEGGFVIH